MNAIEEKIMLGKITALEVGLQGGNIPLELLRRDAEKLLQTPNLTPDLQKRINNLILATLDEVDECF